MPRRPTMYVQKKSQPSFEKSGFASGMSFQLRIPVSSSYCIPESQKFVIETGADHAVMLPFANTAQYMNDLSLS